ncbi:MAG: FecCD family ABC transporter permease [Thermoanaerobaculia bacterium]
MRRRARSLLALLVLAWLAVLAVGVLLGGSGAAATARVILFELRLPRVLLALAAGGALAVAGLTFQTLFRNSLAEPYTLGVASGAALGAVLALQVGGDSVLGFPLTAAASFAGALLVTVLLLGLARRGLETTALLLSGVALALSCSAVILFVQYVADPSRSFRMVRWMMGGLAVVGYREVLWVVPWVVAGSCGLWLLRGELDQMLTGEELAASRGVDVDRLRLVALAAASLMVGALVAVTGPIGFVGLIVPHLGRRLVGRDHMVLLPACLLGGGVFLALADLMARRVMAPAELPVGILTALLGGPFFLWLLVARPRGGRR